MAAKAKEFLKNIPWASLALGSIQTLYGALQSRKLDKMKTPQYKPTEQLQNSYNRAEDMARNGFTPQETASFQQGLARSQNTGYRRAVDMGGGNLAGAINAGINYSNIGAQLQFAAADAEQKRSNIRYADTIGKEYQRLDDMNTGVGIDQLQQARMEAGGALKAGTENIAGSLNLAQALTGSSGGDVRTRQMTTSAQPLGAGQIQQATPQSSNGMSASSFGNMLPSTIPNNPTTNPGSQYFNYPAYANQYNTDPSSLADGMYNPPTVPFMPYAPFYNQPPAPLPTPAWQQSTQNNRFVPGSAWISNPPTSNPYK